MKKSINLLSLLLFAFVSASAQQGGIQYSLKGTIQGLEGRKVYFSVFGPPYGMDSTRVSNGRFLLKGTLQEPSPIIVSLEREFVNKDHFLFFSDGGLCVFTLDKESLGKSKVKGSAATMDFEMLKSIEAPFDDQLQSIYHSAEKDTSLQSRKNMEHQMELVSTRKEDAIEGFVRSHAASPVAAWATYRNFYLPQHAARLESLYEVLSPSYHNASYAKEMKTAIENFKRLSIGKMAPVFTQNDTSGRSVSLSDFMGKYVLLDFWASWCGPCRAENPAVVKVFNAYKDKGFAILSVSLDGPGKKQAWLDAIHKDGLNWTHVSDLKYWQNEVAQLYGVKAVPTNFLIDPSGRIIGKDLHGDALSLAIARALDK